MAIGDSQYAPEKHIYDYVTSRGLKEQVFVVHSKHKALITESVLAIWLIYHLLTIGFIEKQIQFYSFPSCMHIVEEGTHGYRNKLFP